MTHLSKCNVSSEEEEEEEEIKDGADEMVKFVLDNLSISKYRYCLSTFSFNYNYKTLIVQF